MTFQELRNKFPASLEYLAQILLIERDNGVVPNAKLADRLNVSRPAVTQAVGRLKKLKLVEQDRYGAIRLTEEGRSYAEQVISRHFLIEHLLVSILDYPWEKADAEAETLQSYLSDDLTDYLAQKLGYPKTCPHGNPFPGTDIEKRYLESPCLTEAEAGMKVAVLRITEEGELCEGLLGFCQLHSIEPGRKLRLLENTSDAILCETDSGEKVALPLKYARHVRWEKV